MRRSFWWPGSASTTWRRGSDVRGDGGPDGDGGQLPHAGWERAEPQQGARAAACGKFRQEIQEVEPGQTGQQLRATAEEEVSQQQPHLCSLQHLQQEDHEYYPVGRQCGELLVLVRNIFKNTNSCDKVFVICCQICCWLLIFLWLSKCQESQYINQREISTFLTDFLMWSLLNSRLRLESPYSSLWQGSSSSSTEPTVFKSFSLAMCDVIISYHVLLSSL